MSLQWCVDNQWHDTDNSALLLPIRPGDYQRLTQGEGSRYSRTRLSVKLVNYGFEATCRISNIALRAAIQRLAKVSIYNPTGNHQLIQIYDFCGIEEEDLATAVANKTPAYTVRQGMIPPDSIKASGSVNGFDPSPDLHSIDGFTFTFWEYAKRLS